MPFHHLSILTFGEGGGGGGGGGGGRGELSDEWLNTFRGSWLVGCFGFNGPLRQYFSLSRAISQREGERGEKG